MSEYPSWLPELFTLEQASRYANDTDNFELYVNVAYKIYIREFKNERFEFKSKVVSTTRDPQINGMDYTFHHMITRDEDETKREEDREFDFRRIERVRWPKAIILNNGDFEHIKIWTQNKRGRTLLWFEDEYLVVLEERKDSFYFITAYMTEREHRKRKLQKEYEKSKK